MTNNYILNSYFFSNDSSHVGYMIISFFITQGNDIYNSTANNNNVLIISMLPLWCPLISLCCIETLLVCGAIVIISGFSSMLFSKVTDVVLSSKIELL